MNIHSSPTDVGWLVYCIPSGTFPLTYQTISSARMSTEVAYAVSSVCNWFTAIVDFLPSSLLEQATPVVDAIKRTPAVASGPHGHPVHVKTGR